MVLGGHGDTMVPLISLHDRVAASRSRSCSTQDKLDAIVDRTRNGGAEIVAFLKTGSAYYAPSAARGADGRGDRARPEAHPAVLGLAPGRVRAAGLFCGVPCKLGRGGLEQIIEVELTDRGAGRAAQVRRGGARAMQADRGRRERGGAMNRLAAALAVVGRQEGGHGGDRADPGRLPDHPHARPTCWSSTGPTGSTRYARVPAQHRRGCSGAARLVLLVAADPARRGGGAAHARGAARRGRSATPEAGTRRSRRSPRAPCAGAACCSWCSSSITSCTSRIGTAHPRVRSS